MTELVMKRRGFDLYNSNPFIDSTSVAQRRRRVMSKTGSMMLVEPETGEIVHGGGAGFWESEEIDSTRFIKLFVNGVRALTELTNAGTKVFAMLYAEMQSAPNKDRAWLSFSGVNQAITPMSESTYTRGMRELINKKFIAATPQQGWFWVNPDYIWNGDRLAFVKEYRIKKADQRKSDQREREALEARGQLRLTQ